MRNGMTKLASDFEVVDGVVSMVVVKVVNVKIFPSGTAPCTAVLVFFHHLGLVSDERRITRLDAAIATPLTALRAR
jgi:hypothetical protein